MPITLDILDHDLLGPEYRRGLDEGMQKRLEQGTQQGELTLLRRQIEKRFGPISDWVQEQLSALSSAQLEYLGVRLLDPASLDQLLQ